MVGWLVCINDDATVQADKSPISFAKKEVRAKTQFSLHLSFIRRTSSRRSVRQCDVGWTVVSVDPKVGPRRDAKSTKYAKVEKSFITSPGVRSLCRISRHQPRNAPDP